MTFIDDPRKWRLSKSGFSIKTGWADEKKIIASYPGAGSPLNGKQFQEWIDNANRICELHNKSLAEPDAGWEQECKRWHMLATLRAGVEDQRDEYFDALHQLVSLKDMKDALADIPEGSSNHAALKEIYERRKPIAWEKARAVVAKEKP